MDSAVAIIAGLLLLESIAAIAGAVYVAWTLRAERGREPFLDRLINRNLRVAIGTAPIVFLVVYSLVRFGLPQLQLGPLEPPFGALLIGVALALLLWGPISDAITIWQERRDTDVEEKQ
jgi:hypothetical protein